MLLVEDVCGVGKLGAWPAASPTSVLEDPFSDLMAEWTSTWTSTPAASAGSRPLQSPIRASPLRPCSSEPAMPPHQSTPAPKRATRSLVETLHECLTSLPQASAIMADAERSSADPSGATTTSATRQSSSRPPGKRRPRASRRTPTTIFETDPSEFRDMVQKLTGIPVATAGAAPVRPKPQRAGCASSALRPDTLRSIRRLPPMGPPLPPLPSPVPPFLQHLQRSRTSEVTNPAVKPAQSFPGFARSCKREFDAIEDPSSPSSLGSYPSHHEPLMKRVMSAPTTSIAPWWEQQQASEPQNATNISPSENMSTDAVNAPFAMASPSYSESLARETLEALSSAPPPELARIDSTDGQLVQEEQDFNLSQIESWLSVDSTMGEPSM